MNYKEKIRKLLALAESNNEHEAKAALLKARELMAEYKIEEYEVVDVKSKKVKRIYTDYFWTKRGEYWIGALADIIAENYCCRSASYIPCKGAQKRQIFFIGLEDDVDLCAKIFEYAVDSARKFGNLYLKDKYKGYKLTAQDKNRVKNSYAVGFTKGVREAFETQKAETETGWGLVMVVPQEVNDDCVGFRNDTYKSRNRVIYKNIRDDGYEEGCRFNPNRKLEAC